MADKERYIIIIFDNKKEHVYKSLLATCEAEASEQALKLHTEKFGDGVAIITYSGKMAEN